MTDVEAPKQDKGAAHRARRNAYHKALNFKRRLHDHQHKANMALGIIMSSSNAPDVDSLEYVATIILLNTWPQANVNHEKSVDKLDAAFIIAKGIIRRHTHLRIGQIEYALYQAHRQVTGAFKRYSVIQHEGFAFPTDVLLAAVEHNLARPRYREMLASFR